MQETSLLLQLIGDVPLFKIIDFFIENKGLDYSKEEVVARASISRATLFNYWEQIEKYGLVRVTKTLGKTKYYTLNTNNVIIKRILDLETALIQGSLEMTQKKELSGQEMAASAEEAV